MNFVTAKEVGKEFTAIKKENAKLKEWNTKYKKENKKLRRFIGGGVIFCAKNL